MKIRECQVVFFVVGLRTGLRHLLCGEGQALALRYWGWCPPWAPRSTGDTRLRAR